MNDLRDTDGLIVDLRQYPSDTNMHTFLSMYLQRAGTVYNIMTVPSQSVPGTFTKQKMVSMGVTPAIFYYEKLVVVLMDELSVSNSEFSIMDLRTGDHVVVLGNNSLGTDGEISFGLPAAVFIPRRWDRLSALVLLQTLRSIPPLRASKRDATS